MELLYVWVENYEDTFRNKGFNMSTEYDITYKDCKLNIKKNKNAVSIFPPIINSCKAIIGENGSGKSTFIRMLLEVLNYNFQYKKILIFKVNDEIKIYINSDSSEIDFNVSEEKPSHSIYDIECSKNEEYNKLVECLEVINYSPAVNINYKSWFGIKDKWKDISTDWLLRQKYVEKGYRGGAVKQPTLISLRYRDQMKIMDFLWSGFEFETTKFTKPTKLKFDITLRTRRKVYNASVSKKYYELLHKLISNDERNKIAIWAVVTELIYKQYDELGRDYKKDEDLKAQTQKCQQSFDVVKGLVENSGEKLTDVEINKIAEEILKVDNEEISDKKAVIEFLTILAELEYQDKYAPTNNEPLVFDEQLMTAFLDESDRGLAERIFLLCEYPFIQDITQCRWSDNERVSTGQESALMMYSRFYSVFEKLFQEKCKTNLIILLDEPDIYFHPNWKRHFLNDFIMFLEVVNKRLGFDFKVQLFITTNEPYIISDLPKDNIIFPTDKNAEAINDEVKETFGANIHTLLNNSFFMNNTIGEYANETIRGTVKIIDKYKKYNENKDEKNIEEFEEEYTKYMNYEEQVCIHKIIENIDMLKKKIEYVISIIGEPIIKRKLEDMYISAFKINKDYYLKEILKLQEERDELRRVLKDKSLDNIDNVMKLLEKRIEELKDKVGD